MSSDLFPAVPPSSPDRLTLARRRLADAQAAYDRAVEPDSILFPSDEITWGLIKARTELYFAEQDELARQHGRAG